MERRERNQLFFVIAILVVAIILLMVPDNNNSMSEGGDMEPVVEVQGFGPSDFSRAMESDSTETAPPALDIKMVGIEGLEINDLASIQDVMDAAEGHGFAVLPSEPESSGVEPTPPSSLCIERVEIEDPEGSGSVLIYNVVDVAEGDMDFSPSPADDDLVAELAEASAPYAQIKLVNLIAWLEINEYSSEAEFVESKIEALGEILQEMISLDFEGQARGVHFSHLIAGLMPVSTVCVQDTDLFNAQIDLLALLAHRAMADGTHLKVLIEIANHVSALSFDHETSHDISIPNHRLAMRKIEIFRETVEGLTR